MSWQWGGWPHFFFLMTITLVLACASVTSPSLPFSFITPWGERLRLPHSRQLQDYLMESRHWNSIVKWPLFSLSCWHIIFFCMIRLVYSSPIIYFSTEWLFDHHKHFKRQPVNKSYSLLPGFPSSLYVLNGIEFLVWGKEFRCGCRMGQKWTK